LIGGTPIVPLRFLVPPDSARVLVKLESANPTGSMKDRMALAMIEAAEADGRIGPAGVVEYTTGNTGMALALIGAVKRLPVSIVTSDAYAPEKRDHMSILGANLKVISSDEGKMTEKLTKDIIAAAGDIASQTGAYWTDQLNNTDQLRAYHTLAEEIIAECGVVDAFVQSVGSAASFRGVSERLRELRPQVRTIAVEPAESPVLAGGRSGAHKIDGMGAGFVVPLWRASDADAIEDVTTEEAMSMSLRLAREEGLYGGPSTGANVAAALRVARTLGRNATVVTLLCDTGMKYLRTLGNLVREAGPISTDAR
jgi:cysteine synthase A